MSSILLVSSLGSGSAAGSSISGTTTGSVSTTTGLSSTAADANGAAGTGEGGVAAAAAGVGAVAEGLEGAGMETRLPIPYFFWLINKKVVDLAAGDWQVFSKQTTATTWKSKSVANA